MNWCELVIHVLKLAAKNDCQKVQGLIDPQSQLFPVNILSRWLITCPWTRVLGHSSIFPLDLLYVHKISFLILVSVNWSPILCSDHFLPLNKLLNLLLIMHENNYLAWNLKKIYQTLLVDAIFKEKYHLLLRAVLNYLFPPLQELWFPVSYLFRKWHLVSFMPKALG